MVNLAAADALHLGADLASAAYLGVNRIWSGLSKVSDLTYPLAIAHRGAANMFPEDTLAAYEGALDLGISAIEVGDVRALADDTLVCMHDPTVDRTTTSSGNVNSFSEAGWRSLVVDSSTWFGGNVPNMSAPVWTDALASVGGKTVIFPEVTDGLLATATAICDTLDTLGLSESAVVQCTGAAYSVCQYTAGRGYPTLALYGGAMPDPATLASDGIWAVGVDWTDPALTSTFVSSCHEAGIKVFAYTTDRQNEWDAVIALGCDGAFTNEPLYAPRNTAAYWQTTTTFDTTATWAPGMMALYDEPETVSNRGDIIGSPGSARWRLANGHFFTEGELLPLANPSGTYTITLTYATDAIPSAAWKGIGIYFCSPDDSITSGDMTGDQHDSYLVKLRSGGQIAMWSISTSGSVADQGSQSTTAVVVPTLSSGLAAGIAITALPVSAITAALQVGHQFYLPNGQVATVSATAARYATSITINSLTPTVAVASGSTLSQRITLSITVSPTAISAWRVDGSSHTAKTFSDTARRGAYLSLSCMLSNGQISVESLTVT